MITEPGGVYSISAEAYHAMPALSSSLARILLGQSPLHCWHASPALNPRYEPEYANRFDLGTAAHAHLLEGETGFEIINEIDYRTKDARKARDAARAAGRVPIPVNRWADVQAMALAVREQLDRHEDPPIPFTNGKAEQSLIWREGDVSCRARLDWLHDDHRTVDDMKSTDGTANPDAWSRGPLFNSGYDVQCAFYLRSIKAVFGVEALFRFVVCETRAPYAVSVVSLSPAALALADRKVDRAIAIWRECVSTGQWPAYPARTCYADAPPWEEARWLEREGRDWQPEPKALVDDGTSLADQLFGPER